MEKNAIICSNCGHKEWFITPEGFICSKCNNKLADYYLSTVKPEIGFEIIKQMGIPHNHPNALELAIAHLNRLYKKEAFFEEVLEKINKF